MLQRKIWIRLQKQKNDPEKELFGRSVGLTVSGQLEAETFATAFKRHTHLGLRSGPKTQY